MNKNLIYLSLVLLIPLLLISCRKKSTVTRSHENQVLEYFPNSIGSRFIYFYFDSLSMHSDTVTVSIVDTITYDNIKQLTVWEYIYSSKIDTRYVYSSGDTVKIYNDLENWWINTTYLFPLEIGKGWRGGFINDTSTVVDQVSITVPAGEFANTFLIEETWGALNEYGYILTWFVPEVGIVKKLNWQRGWSSWARETWELIGYHIATEDED